MRFLRYDIPFNYAAINNFAVRHCDSPYLLFLNNDTEVTSAGWLTGILEFAQHNDIGAVGGRSCSIQTAPSSMPGSSRVSGAWQDIVIATCQNIIRLFWPA